MLFVISKQAILAAVITFIDEFVPNIGICVVMSDSANAVLLMPVFSEPRIKHSFLWGFISRLNSSEDRKSVV